MLQRKQFYAILYWPNTIYSIKNHYLNKIKESEIRQVKLLDRTFNCMPDRALRIARYMNEECKNQIFQFEIVAETLSEKLIDFFVHEADKKRFRFEYINCSKC